MGCNGAGESDDLARQVFRARPLNPGVRRLNLAASMTPTKRSATLGRLKYEPDYRQYVTDLVHKGAKINLRLNCESDDQIDRLLPFAEKVWRGRVRHFKAFREFAVSDLLELLNEFLDCGEEDPPQVTVKQLRQMLRTPFSMTFFLDGNDQDILAFEISGGDDYRLREHCITVYFDEDGNVTNGEAVALF